jgi:iron complex transport system ATP-binding protein
MLCAQNICFKYEQKDILKNVDLELKEGDVISLLGPNGAGKSTLIKILLGLLQPVKGKVFLEEKLLNEYSAKELAKKIAYVPQKSFSPFSYKVLEVVMMGRLAYQTLFSHYTKEDKIVAQKSLDMLGIRNLEDEAYNQLSGGQQQLVLIARALAQEAKIFIMDEPVSGLDYGNQLRLLTQIQSLSKKGYTFLKSTHYPDHALMISNKTVLMKEGKIFAKGESLEVINEQNIKILYGVDVEIAKFKNKNICIPSL